MRKQNMIRRFLFVILYFVVLVSTWYTFAFSDNSQFSMDIYKINDKVIVQEKDKLPILTLPNNKFIDITLKLNYQALDVFAIKKLTISLYNNRELLAKEEIFDFINQKSPYLIPIKIVKPYTDKIYLQVEGSLDIAGTLLYTRTPLVILDFSGNNFVFSPLAILLPLLIILVLTGIIFLVYMIFMLNKKLKSTEKDLLAKQSEVDKYKNELKDKERELEKIFLKLHSTEEELKNLQTQIMKNDEFKNEVKSSISIQEKIVEAFNRSHSFSEWEKNFTGAEYYRITLSDLSSHISIIDYTEYSFEKSKEGLLVLIETEGNKGYVIPICGITFSGELIRYYKDFFNCPIKSGAKIKEMIRPAYVEVIGNKLKIIEKGELVFEGEDYKIKEEKKEEKTIDLIKIDELIKEIDNLKNIIHNYVTLIENLPSIINKEFENNIDKKLSELKIEIKEDMRAFIENLKLEQFKPQEIELPREEEIREEIKEKVKFPILQKCVDIYNKYYNSFNFETYKKEVQEKLNDVDIEIRYWIDEIRGYRKEYVYLKVKSEEVESIFPILKEYSMPPEKAFIREFLVNYYEIPQSLQLNIKQIKIPVILKGNEITKGKLEI